MSLWIFGYGSLVWRPAFPYAERRPATLQDWARRFWQGSTDHRGVPEAPGRVVTLVRAPGEACQGIAYRVPEDQRSEVLEHLDHRERGGYERRRVPLRFDESSEVHGLVYIATAANPNYLGPAPLAAISAQILRSEGPSGPNPEYVIRLAEALRDIGADDAHVFALEARIRHALDPC